MRSITLILTLSLALTVPAYAKPKKAGKPYGSRNVEVSQSDTFSPAERHRIRVYLSNQERQPQQPAARDLPPGLQKKLARGKSLPPGWQKKLESGRSLDYQVYRQGTSLPEELILSLPPGPVGSEIIRIGEEIIRVHTATRTILDFFNLIQGQQ